MKNRAAFLAAVAGLAACGSTALADGVVFNAANTTGYGIAPSPGNTVMGQALTILDPTPDPIALTGIDIYIANNTGATIAATTPIRITVFVWDEENPSTVASDPAYLTLLRTEVGTFAAGLGFAWAPLTYLPIEAANPTLPGLTFSTPITGFTDTEMAVSIKMEMDTGTGFGTVPGLTVVNRGGTTATPVTIGTSPGYYYRNASLLVDGNHLVSDARNVGVNSAIGIRLYNQSSASTPLAGDPGSNPANAQSSCDGTNVALLVQVTPGTLPDSTGITVTGDTTVFGGGPNTAFLDDGTNGDGAAGDNLFGHNVVLPAGPEGVLSVPFNVSDAEGRTASGTIAVNRDRNADLPANILSGGTGSTTITGARTFNDNDMFAICVSDPNNFGANSVGGTTWDSQLFLFDAAGMGVLHNDDDPNDLTGATFQANITGVPLASGGLYYLAISGYNRDPASVGNFFIWNQDDGAGNFNTVRAPDGAGAANPVSLWIGTGNAGGEYSITLTGATSVCPADLTDGTGEFKPDCAVTIDDLLVFLTGFEAGDVRVDLSGSGGSGPDCAVTIDDLLFFLAHFELGC